MLDIAPAESHEFTQFLNFIVLIMWDTIGVKNWTKHAFFVTSTKTVPIMH